MKIFKTYKKVIVSIAITLVTALLVTTFSPIALAEEPEPSVPDLSDILCITIDEFSPETRVSELLSNTSLTDSETLEVYDKEGFPISNSGYVTNSSTIFIKSNGIVNEAYKVRIYGDLNCDGCIDTLDISELKNCLAGVTINDEISADANADSIVDTVDLSVLKLYSAGAKNTKQNSQYALTSRINWLNENKADYKIYGYTEEFSDSSVSSNDIDLTFSRYYDSCNTNIGILGEGWTASFEGSCLTYEGTSKIVSIYGQTPVVFEYSNNEYCCEYSRSSLTVTAYGYEYTGEDDLKYVFNSNGYLTKISDKNNNTVNINVNNSGKIQKVTDSVGREYLYTYNSNGYLSKITDPAGRNVNYSYDSYNRLVSVTGVMGSVTQKYGYTVADRLKTVYDAFDNILTQVNYNENGVVTSVTDDDGNTINYSYNPSSNSISVSEDGNVTECYVYNRYNFLSVAINDEGKTENSFLNSYGDVIESNVEDVEKTSYILDADGNVLEVKTVTDEETVTEKNTYDNDGNLLTSTTGDEKYIYTYDSNGNVLTVTKQVNGEVTESATYTYNSKGLVVSDTEDGKITEYTYDSNNYVTNIKTVENDIETNVHFNYNIIGQVLTQTEEGLTTSYVYDLYGNAIRETQSVGTVTRVNRIVYDDKNRVIQKICDEQYNVSDEGIAPNSNGICYTNVYNNCNVGERYTYDTNDNVLTYINKADNKTVNTYDSENRLVKTVTYENASTTANGLTTRYVYDADGNLIQTVYPHQYNAENDNLDVSNDVNEYTDNTIGERVTYDDDGNVLTYIDSFGKETVNTYDSNGNLVKSVSGNETTRFVYNGGDNLLQVIYPNQYNPDDDNLNLSAETPVDTYANANVGDRYTYDDNGNILTYTNQYSEVTTNTYDADGSLISTTKPDGTVFTFDEDGRAKKETYSNGLVRDFTYSTNQTVISGSNGITVTYNLNSFGEVAEYKLQNGENDKNYSYTYDSDGNITTISLNGSLQQTFTYNSSNELVRVDDAVINKTITYDYDYVGNITSVKTYIYTTGTLGTPLTTQNYTYNSQNQRTDLSYDANGNMTELNGYTFGWTNRRLTSATSTDNSISYTYNHDGIRTSKTINGITTYYVVDENNNVVKQYELENDVETNVIEFVYDSNGSPIYFTYNNATYYYEKNLQGDIVAILDASGNTVVEYSYDIWGELVNVTGSLADTIGTINPLRYRGYYYDTETNLYYLQSRYYSPDLMRFISQDDPVLSNAQGEPIGSNLYAYCLNNPANYSDPSGCWVFTLGVSIGGAIILGLNLFATLLIDSTGDFGLFLGVTLLYGVIERGLSYSFGFYWKFNKIKNYLNAVTNSLTIGYGVGGSLVYHYYKYPSSKKRIVGLQVSYGTKGICWETAAFDGGIYTFEETSNFNI